MFSYLQLAERKRELFTERALGMKVHQISLLFFTEIMILLLSAIVLGSVFGSMLMQMLSLFITQTDQYPIYTIVLPVTLLIVTNTILVLLSIFASIIPAYYSSRQDISRGFTG